MEEGSVKELVAYRFSRAEENLKAAKQMMEDEFLEFALNRTYYAIFCAIRAVNAIDGFDSSKHSGVIAHFNQFHVKTGDFSVETSSIIRQASTFREKSDYEDFFEATKEIADDTLEKANSLISEVENFLKKKGFLPKD